MNYIRHLNGFFERLAEDERLSSYHISLYIALFQHWNANRFSDQFIISRTEVMRLARIGSANTYARCMRDLTDWGYIAYFPSSNLHSGSKVSCIRFDIGSDTACDTGIKSDTASDTATGTTTEISISGDLNSDTASDITTDTTNDTGTSGNLKSDTGADTTGDTGIRCDTGTDKTADTASDTGIITGTENDTGRSTATGINEPAGIESDTGTDTASDTLFINITKKNKLKEESSKRNSKEKVSEEEEIRKRDGEPKIQIPGIETVRNFFEQNRSSPGEAQKFYTRYQSSGWKTGDMKAIASWQALARKWIENNQNNKADERKHNQNRTGQLSVTVNKNYDEPL
ncbi:MAG: hypothetical protein RBS73_05015 [Prolixibacteraceae bacterium]|jgi:hypothetical protein|nr:hypothetical protein [Prolixibacteraceae bacterium]